MVGCPRNLGNPMAGGAGTHLRVGQEGARSLGGLATPGAVAIRLKTIEHQWKIAQNHPELMENN